MSAESSPSIFRLSGRSLELADRLEELWSDYPTLEWQPSYRIMCESIGMVLHRVETQWRLLIKLRAAGASSEVLASEDELLRLWMKTLREYLREMGYTKRGRDEIAATLREAGERDEIWVELVESIANNLMQK